MDSDSNRQLRQPKLLKILASDVRYPGENTMLHQFVLDNSDPNHSGSENYINAVLLSMSDLPVSVVNAVNSEGYSALHLAIFKNNLQMVRKLLSYLINIDAECDIHCKGNDTPISLAVRLGHLKITQELFNKGVNIDKKNKIDETALHIAVRLNGEREGNETSLQPAVRWKSLEIVKLLISNGADVNAKDKDNKAPLHSAVRSKSLEIAKLLISNGAHVNAKDEDNETPLHFAVRLESLEIVKLLISNGADVNAKYEDNEILLHSAVPCDGPQCLRARMNSDLHSAVLSKILEIVKLLISNGADVNAKYENNETPLHSAVRLKSLEIVKLLISKGADVNSKYEDNETPLLCSAIEKLRNC